MADIFEDGMRVLDFGCGKGFDVIHLKKHNHDIVGYDAFHEQFSSPPDGKFDLVMCNFVLNVLPKKFREEAFDRAYSYAKRGGIVFVSARPKNTLRPSGLWTPYQDGWLTSALTFQMGFTTEGLKYFCEKRTGSWFVAGKRSTFVYCWSEKS